MEKGKSLLSEEAAHGNIKEENSRDAAHIKHGLHHKSVNGRV